MADKTVYVVKAGAQTAPEPPWILLPGLAHIQARFRLGSIRRATHHAKDLRATSTLAPMAPAS